MDGSVYDISCLYEYELSDIKGQPYKVRVNYTSLCNNAYEGASRLIMGTKGGLYLYQCKGTAFPGERTRTQLHGRTLVSRLRMPTLQ